MTPIITTSPLQLNWYYIVEFSCKQKKGYQRTDDLGRVVKVEDLEVNVNNYVDKDNPLQWLFNLRVSLKEDAVQYPYHFYIEMIGSFTVSPNWPEEQRSKLAETNGPAVLFSAARELLALITERGVRDPIYLPTVTFLRDIRSEIGVTMPKQEKEEVKEKQELAAREEEKHPKKRGVKKLPQKN